MNTDDRIMMIIVDGLGDRYIEDIGGTILQVAKVNAMDKLAENGISGIMDPISPGIRPGSDTAHLSLFGYDPYKIYTGRGPFEAAGIGIKVKKGDVAFRCNFATVDENMRVIDRRAGRIKYGTSELAKSLNGMNIDGIKIIFKESTEHRGVLVLRGKHLSPYVSDIDPHKSNVRFHESKPLTKKKDDELTAYVLNKFVLESYRILKDHPVNKERIKNNEKPANIILPRGAGIVSEIEPFTKKYDIKACCIAGVSLVKGIARVIGMDVIDVKGATGGVNTDITAKISEGIKQLDNYDFVVINIKAPDIYGHDGDTEGKIRIVQKIDNALIDVNDIDAVRILTSDHSTPVSVMNHSADTVPITIVGNGVRKDNVKHYDEISCASGGLNRIQGKNLMNIVMDIANRIEKFGA